MGFIGIIVYYEIDLGFCGFGMSSSATTGSAIVRWEYIGSMEKDMELTIVYWGYVGDIILA